MLKLYKYEVDVTEEKSASDTSLVRANGVTVNVYRQGATANGSGSSSPITVHDLGTIVQDGLVLKADSVEGNSISATVNGVPSSQTSIAYDGDGGSFSWSDASRIVNTSNTPSIYSDNQGAEELAGSTTTTDANGVATFYAREPVLDIELDDGTNTQLLVDVAGEATRNIVTLEEFGGIGDGATDNAQAMTDAITYVTARNGGIIELGIGTYNIGSAITSSGTNDITIRGQGTGNGGQSVIADTAGSGALFTFSGTRSNFRFENFTLNAVAGTTSLVNLSGTLTGFVFEDMTFVGSDGSVIGVIDTGVDTRYNRVKFEGQFANFIKLNTATRPHINSLVGRMTGSITAGIYITGTTTRARLSHLDIKTSGLSSSVGGTAVLIDNSGCEDIVISDSYFVGGTNTGAAPAVKIDNGLDIQLAHNTYSESTIGVDINGGTGITILGGTVDTINTDGIDVATADYVQIIGVRSKTVGATDSHIKINTDKVMVNGLSVSGNGDYAVELGSSAAEIQISNLSGTAPSTAWILNGSSDTEIHLANNQDSLTTLSATETTVAVLGIRTLIFNHSGATSFANMTGGLQGQEVTCIAGTGGNTTFVDTGNLQLEGAANFVMTNAGDCIRFAYEATLAKWVELSRSTNA